MNNGFASGIIAFSVSVASLLAGCAAEARQQPTQWQVLSGTPAVIEVRDVVTLEPSTGYSRTLAAGSVWREVGRITEGRVFRPLNAVLTAEGSHVYEAYLVIEGDRAVGLYLPVERSFVSVPPKPINYQNKGN